MHLGGGRLPDRRPGLLGLEEEGKLRLAPEQLNPGEWRRLRRWAEDAVPWLSRGAFGSTASLEGYVATVLEWGRSRRVRRVWVAACQVWIRRDERRRLEELARRGDASARNALRDPIAWRERFDAWERALAMTPQPGDPEEIRPTGGTVHRLGR
jgi:hypothetical protein